MLVSRSLILKKCPFHPLQAHIDLNIPKEHHRFIIGREGQKLKSIELQTATKISVPRSDSHTDIIKIVGTREGVDKARHQIQLISDEQVVILIRFAVEGVWLVVIGWFCLIRFGNE